MENVIQELSQLANEMEGASLSKLAANVDKVAERTLWVKKAQYVGAQGYWIRNSRCWQNCYRQKRASEPKRPVHDIWWECQEEYTEAINNDDAAWNKYADENSFVKTAENKEMVDHEEQVFRYAVAKNIDAGMPFENAVHESLQEGMERYSVALIDNADRMMHVAESLKEAGQEQMSAKAVDIANHLVHEAEIGDRGGFLGGVKDKFQGVFQKTKYIASRLQNTINKLQKVRSTVPQGGFDTNNQVQQATQFSADFNSIMVELEEEVKKLQGISLGNNQEAQNLLNSAMQYLNQRVGPIDGKQVNKGLGRGGRLDQIVSGIQGVLSALNKAQADPQAAPQASPQAAPQAAPQADPKAGPQAAPGKQQGAPSGGLNQSEITKINNADINTLVNFINSHPEVKEHFIARLSRSAAANSSRPYTKTAFNNDLSQSYALVDEATKKQFLEQVYTRITQNPQELVTIRKGLGIQDAPAVDPKADVDQDQVPDNQDTDVGNDRKPDAEQQPVAEEDEKSPNEGIEKLMTRELVRNPKQFGGSFVKVLQDFCSDPAKKGLCGPILLTLKDQILGMMQGAPDEQTGKRYQTQFSDQEVVASTQDLRKKASAAKFLKKVKGVSV
tara:strand:- start:10112 stop:11956 length:1845 start_codon:yes stop_codon:yes gene_type:complete